MSCVRSLSRLLLLTALLFTSCHHRGDDSPLLATVYGHELHESDLEGLVGAGVGTEDSAAIVASYVEQWIRQTVLLAKAEKNIVDNFDRQLNEYKNSLLIYAYEQKIVNQLLDLGNLVWMTLFLPYVFIVWCGGLTGWQALAMLFMLHLMVLVNSQWYLFVRTLVNQSIFWWALPIVFYGSLVLPFFVLSDKQIDQLLDFVFDGLDTYAFSWWSFLLFAVLFVILFAINRRLQMQLVYSEISKNEKTTLRSVSEFQSLNRFGQIGEYLKFEIKSTMRNKAIRSRFIQGVCFITFFSLMIAFTSVYNSSFERNFWCLYAFIFFGSVNLTKVMCPEGNYIDLLMVHEENILTLLRAKYYYYCAVLVLPFIFTLVPVFTGKFSLIMVLAYLFTVTGPVYCMLFQMAVYNKQTLPLNEKITGKNQMENKWQAIVSISSMFGPVVVVFLLQAIFDEQTAYWLLFIVGVAFTLTEQYWMRHIYRRMMRRRYDNLEGFRASR